MKNIRRAAIADKSRLAHNVYEMILRPLGFSLFPFRTLTELKENLDWKWNLSLFLVSSNVFGRHFEKHLEWFQKEKVLQAIPKIFLCDGGEKKCQILLKKLSNSHIVVRPFHPKEFEEKVRACV